MSTIEGNTSNADPTSKEKGPPKICDSYDSEDADIELISSDNVVFRVHSYQLQCVSPVFRSMIAMANSASQRDPIPLTHPTIDHSRVVIAALDLIHDLNINGFPSQRDVNLIKYVIDFARKWEIVRITNIIRDEMARNLHSTYHGPHPFEHFLICLYLGDNQLASQYFGLKKMGSWDYYKHLQNQIIPDQEVNDTSGDINTGADSEGREANLPPKHYLSDNRARGLMDDAHIEVTPSQHDFDLGTIPYEAFLRLPPTVVWIILRAQNIERGETQRAAEEERRPECREEIIENLLYLAYPRPEEY